MKGKNKGGISTSNKRGKRGMKRKPWREYEYQKLVYLCEVEGLTQSEASKQIFGRTRFAVIKRCTELKADGEWDRIKAENERSGFTPRTGVGRTRKIKDDQLELDLQMPRPSAAAEAVLLGDDDMFPLSQDKYIVAMENAVRENAVPAYKFVKKGDVVVKRTEKTVKPATENEESSLERLMDMAHIGFGLFCGFFAGLLLGMAVGHNFL